MKNKTKKYLWWDEFKPIKIGNILLNTNVDNIIDEEIEETKVLINQVKDINQLVEA